VPFFSHLLQNASENRCPGPQKFRTQGLATLSTAYQLLNPSEASLSPQHSWDSPFRAFLLTCDRSPLTKTPLRPCTPLENHSGLLPVLQRLDPTSKAVPLVAPQRFSLGRDLLLSWASDLSGAPSDRAKVRASPSYLAPLVLPSYALTSLGPGTSGFPASISSAFPSEKGAGLSGLSHQLPSLNHLERELVSDYFFISKTQVPSRKL
jgi:hypothetical protein